MARDIRRSSCALMAGMRHVIQMARAHWVVLAICLSSAVVVTYVGMAGFDPADDATLDSKTYTQMTTGHGDVGKPMRYRVLVPLLARLVPVGNVATRAGIESRYAAVDIVALTLAGWLLWLILRTWKVSPVLALVGVLCFYGSHPVARFGGIPLVEAGALAVLFACYLAVERRQHLAFMLMFAVGMFVKETTLLAAALPFLHQEAWRLRLRLAAFALPGLVLYAVVRLVIDPTTSGVGYSALAWLHNLQTLVIPQGEFAPRWREIVLSLGVIWVFMLLGLRRPVAIPLRYAGMTGISFLLALALTTDYERIIFLSFPFALGFALPELAHRLGGVVGADPVRKPQGEQAPMG